MTVEAAGGTQANSLGEEFTVATLTDAGVYTFVTDLTNMALGDQMTFRSKVKARAGSSSKVFDVSVYTHTQSGAPIIMTMPIPVPHEVIFTMEQNSGASVISVDWAAYRN